MPSSFRTTKNALMSIFTEHPILVDRDEEWVVTNHHVLWLIWGEGYREFQFDQNYGEVDYRNLVETLHSRNQHYVGFVEYWQLSDCGANYISQIPIFDAAIGHPLNATDRVCSYLSQLREIINTDINYSIIVRCIWQGSRTWSLDEKPWWYWVRRCRLANFRRLPR